MSRIKFAWGITGSGHLLKESLECFEKMVENGRRVDLFISSPAETVLKMYNLYNRLKEFIKNNQDQIKHIYREDEQPPAFPICAKFNLHTYDLLILSPLTANSVAKMNVGIADSLITNIFSQMIKGNGQIYVVPCDLIPGIIKTTAPNGEIVEIRIDNFNSQNARCLRKFPTVSVFDHPSKLCEAAKNLYPLD
ncbi:MAG: hypothetical protein DRO88_05050 [Promethearchaeia archaeon]|nr:MAG: hypothetical protein DRO88_05050 [Candidatus Lokiarchaeia archaeon]